MTRRAKILATQFDVASAANCIKVVASPTHQCEANRSTQYSKWWEDRHPDKRCRHGAKFEVDGEKLCQRHACIKALHILLTDSPSTGTYSDLVSDGGMDPRDRKHVEPVTLPSKVKVEAGLVFNSDGVPHQVVYRSPISSDWWFCRDLTKNENDLWEFYEGDIVKHAIPSKTGMMEFCATESIDGVPYSRRFKAESWEDAVRICNGVGWTLDGVFVCEVDADKATPQQMAEFCARRNAGENDS